MAKSSTPRFNINWKALFKWGAALAGLGLLAIAVAVGVAMSSLPDYNQLTKRNDLGQMIKVRGSDGTLLVSMGPNLGRWLTYDEIPVEMREAMTAIEDRRFRYHFGVDPIGLTRAVVSSVVNGHRVRATSTITQQLARNIFLTNKREFGRKAKEAVLAVALEAKFSKDQILELYLNRVYFGGGAYGIDAASRTFFGHGGDTLNLGEAAIIAGLVKAPSNYSPTADIEAARGRARVVLASMVRHGALTQAQADGVEPAKVDIQKPTEQNSVRYFTDWVLPQLDTLIDQTNEPIEVWTTLDVKKQDLAHKAISANTSGSLQGALVSLDRDGAVRAMIGGKDYVNSIYNRATQAERQPGSSFKLFVYLTALEGGISPDDYVVDEPVTVDGWTPRNSTREHLGPITVREAFARSVNTISAKLGQEFGFGSIAGMARRFGITQDISTYPSMVLGANVTRLIDMTQAFASVANDGQMVAPYGITRVTSADGRMLYRRRTPPPRILISSTVDLEMIDMLQTAVMSGTGGNAQIGRPVAGKTGTSSDNKDGWFIGFSSGLTTGVWMGRDDNKAVRGLSGGGSPARAFRDYMRPAVSDRPVERFKSLAPTPDWQLEPDDEAWYYDQPLYDAFGNPIPRDDFDDGDYRIEVGEDGRPVRVRRDDAESDNGPGNQDWLDRVLNRRPQRPETPPPAPRPRNERQPDAENGSITVRTRPVEQPADPLAPEGN